MTYPLNEEVDRGLVEALARVINRAYYAGLEDGREEAAICRE